MQRQKDKLIFPFDYVYEQSASQPFTLAENLILTNLKANRCQKHFFILASVFFQPKKDIKNHNQV